MKILFTIIFTFYFLISFAQTHKEIVDISNEFLETFKDKSKNEVLRDFNDSLRTKWTNLPVGLAKRPGIKYGDLEDEAKKYANILGYNYNSSQWFEQSYKVLNKNYEINRKIKKENKTNFFQKILQKIK